MIKKKLGRKIKHRRLMLKNLASSIIIYEKVKTTEAKAKAVMPIVEKMINFGKEGSLAKRRSLLAYFLHNKNTVDKIISEIAPRFKNIKSGYLKHYKNLPRLGDSSRMVTIILTQSKFLNNLKAGKDKENENKPTKNNKN